MIRALVCAPTAAARADLQRRLAAAGDITVVASVSDVRAIPAADLERVWPDVIVAALDADAIDYLKSHRDARFGDAGVAPRPPIVIVDNERAVRSLADAVRANIQGVVAPDASAEELLAAIRAVAAGLFVAQPDVVTSIAGASPARGVRLAPVDETAHALTAREIEVLQMLAGGLGNKEIARRLAISTHTVKFHIAAIMHKLGASSRTEAVTLGIRRGLIFL